MIGDDKNITKVLQSWGEVGDLEIAGQVRDALQKQGAGQNVGALLIRNLENATCMEERVQAQKRSRVSKTLKKHRQLTVTFQKKQ